MNAIEFNHVSKQYRLGLVSTHTLAHDIRRFWITSILRKEDPYLRIGETNDRASKGNSEYVWALRDIDFKVEQGDVVGIIGKNGAGKSTLLKLLSRVTGPTTGTIRAHGRIGSLLEVGTGFHPEMTGRENIFMNGAILGMSRQEIQAKLDEIIAFSGCERYIDTPVKRYSSGMTVRLGFAVAAFLEPEILVVDEVLAVGDAEFQKKAIGKMKDVSQGEGRTVLFVSHNMGSMRQLCNTGILLDKGSISKTGPIAEVVNEYVKAADTQSLGATWHRPTHDDKDFQILSAEFLNSLGIVTQSFSCDEDIVLELTVHVCKRVPGVYGCILLSRATDVSPIWFTDSNDTCQNKLEELRIGESKIRLRFPKRTIAPGSYVAEIAFNSRSSAGGFFVDGPWKNILRIDVHDYYALRGNQRIGGIGALVDWDIL